MIEICMHPNVYLFYLCLEVELVQGESYPGVETVLGPDGVSTDEGAGGGAGGVSEHKAVPGRAQSPALAPAQDLVTRGAGHRDTGHAGVVEIIDRPVVDGASWKALGFVHSFSSVSVQSLVTSTYNVLMYCIARFRMVKI